MDIFDRHALEELTQVCDEACVSIYMPTHRRGQEVQQNRIRFKNRLDEAKAQLSDLGLDQPEIERLLDQAYPLVENEQFWQNQSDALAVFTSGEMTRLYRLPYSFESHTVVGDRFHLKPLLPLLSSDGLFYTLALSQQEVRLLIGTRYSVGEVNLEEVPDALSDVLKWDDPEQRMQFHTNTQTPVGQRVRTVGGARPAVFHGHGVASEDEPKNQILRFFQRVDEGIREIIAGQNAPLVVAGVDYLQPLYQEANDYPHLVEEGIEGNPETWSAEELHDRAWAILEPRFEQERESDADAFKSLAGRDRDRASDDVEEIVPAATFGRVERLFVSLDDEVWGTFDADANQVTVHETYQPGDKDLLDVAATQTLLNDGTIHTVRHEEMPSQTPLAALFRY